jgi:hypothetical protein
MKLVNLNEFIRLPAGTLYKKQSGVELEIKGDWVSDDGRDWSTTSFAANCGNDQDTHIGLMIGESYPIQTEMYGRDGCFQDDEQFLIYEKWDLEQLKQLLERAIDVSPEQKFKKSW